MGEILRWYLKNLKNCHQLSAMQGRDIVINALRNFAQIMLAVYTRVRFRVLDRTPFWEHTEQGTIGTFFQSALPQDSSNRSGYESHRCNRLLC